MGWGRVVSSVCASGAVAGCAVLAIGMGRAADRPAAETVAPHASVAPTARPAVPARPASTSASASTAASPRPATHAATTTAAPTTPAAPAVTVAPPAVTTTHRAAPSPARPSAVRRTPAKAPARPAAPHTTHSTTHAATHAAPPPKRGVALPLHYSTSTATKVVTVVAAHTSSTTARLQAWTKAPGGGWLRSGAQWTAHVGSQGLTTSPSEFRSATPIGSFSLTRAFGRYSDPGTSLPYHKVDTHDYWISHKGSTYNTMQHCTTAGCHTSADEHLIDADPEYNYAAVINYNTTARVYPNGSAFFLHVSDGGATAGCVSVAQDKMISLLRWLTPSSHPRILIGVG